MYEETTELNSSELGTKSYWDSVYKEELDNFRNHGDIGEVWFGEESIFRITKWLNSEPRIKKDDSIIDIGCGNGMMLIEMARDGFTNLVGIDYSLDAVSLASSIVNEQNMKSYIQIKMCNILVDGLEKENFNVALDKGTYDAISLHPDNSQEKRAVYMQKIYDLLKPRGFFIITSCNWTDKELVNQFSNHFSLYSLIPTPHFTFGGKTGSLVSTVVFEKSQQNTKLHRI